MENHVKKVMLEKEIFTVLNIHRTSGNFNISETSRYRIRVEIKLLCFWVTYVRKISLMHKK